MTELLMDKAATTEEIEKYANTFKDISAVLINGAEVSRIEHTDASMNVDMGGDGDEDLLFQNNSVDEQIVTLTTQHNEAVKENSTLKDKNGRLTTELAQSHAKGEKLERQIQESIDGGSSPLISQLQRRVEELEKDKTVFACKLNTKDGTIASQADTIVARDHKINTLQSEKTNFYNAVVTEGRRNTNLQRQLRVASETATSLNNQITQLKGDLGSQERQMSAVIDFVKKGKGELETKLYDSDREHIRVEKDLRKKLLTSNCIIAFIIVVVSLLAYHLFISNGTVSSSKQASVEYVYENKYSGEEE